MVINYAITMVAWVALLVAWLVVDLPDVRVAPLLLTSFAVILVVPTLFYPFSKTIWAAVEYLASGPQPEVRAEGEELW